MILDLTWSQCSICRLGSLSVVGNLLQLQLTSGKESLNVFAMGLNPTTNLRSNALLGGAILMKTLKTLGTILDRFIWMIGFISIFIYAQDHWPTAYFVATCVFLGGFAIWYLWKFFLLPFKDGLRGH